MKYYSELTRTFYDTEEECTSEEEIYLKAEAEKAKAAEERKLKIEELEQNLKDINKKIKELEELREQICKELNENGVHLNSFISYGLNARQLTEIFRDIFGD
jgi:TolA-binding protein